MGTPESGSQGGSERRSLRGPLVKAGATIAGGAAVVGIIVGSWRAGEERYAQDDQIEIDEAQAEVTAAEETLAFTTQRYEDTTSRECNALLTKYLEVDSGEWLPMTLFRSDYDDLYSGEFDGPCGTYDEAVYSQELYFQIHAETDAVSEANVKLEEQVDIAGTLTDGDEVALTLGAAVALSAVALGAAWGTSRVLTKN